MGLRGRPRRGRSASEPVRPPACAPVPSLNSLPQSLCVALLACCCFWLVFPPLPSTSWQALVHRRRRVSRGCGIRARQGRGAAPALAHMLMCRRSPVSVHCRGLPAAAALLLSSLAGVLVCCRDAHVQVERGAPQALPHCRQPGEACGGGQIAGGSRWEAVHHTAAPACCLSAQQLWGQVGGAVTAACTLSCTCLLIHLVRDWWCAPVPSDAAI